MEDLIIAQVNRYTYVDKFYSSDRELFVETFGRVGTTVTVVCEKDNKEYGKLRLIIDKCDNLIAALKLIDILMNEEYSLIQRCLRLTEVVYDYETRSISKKN